MSDILPNSLLKTAIRENQWDKVKKSSKIGKPLKKLISVSAKFLAAVAKVLFRRERMGTGLYLQPNSGFS